MSSALSSGNRTPGSTPQTQSLLFVVFTFEVIGNQMWYCLHNSSFPLPKLRSFTQCSWKRSFLTSQLFVSNNPYNRNHHVTWGEDIRVEADIESCVADGAHCLTGIQDHFTAFGVCLCLGPKTKFKIFKKHTEMLKVITSDRSCQNV